MPRRRQKNNAGAPRHRAIRATIKSSEALSRSSSVDSTATCNRGGTSRPDVLRLRMAKLRKDQYMINAMKKNGIRTTVNGRPVVIAK
ncbi:hypothetical protein D3C75_1161310 [compost metagenome]